MTKEEKTEKVLEIIKPMCEAFEIKKYDYVIEKGHEYLLLNDVKIGCDCNSYHAIITELVGYLFVYYWWQRYLPFKTQFLNKVKEWWIKDI